MGCDGWDDDRRSHIEIARRGADYPVAVSPMGAEPGRGGGDEIATRLGTGE